MQGLSVLISIMVLIVQTDPKIFTGCEVGEILIENGIKMQQLSKWICLATHTSGLNSSRVLGPNQSRNVGIFQISEFWYCYSEQSPLHYECRINCSQLLDDNIQDDLRCAALIERRQGFEAWQEAFKIYCTDESTLPQYTKDCNFSDGDPPYIINEETNLWLPINSKNRKIHCEANGTQGITLQWTKFDSDNTSSPSTPPEYLVEGPKFESGRNVTKMSLVFPFVTQASEGLYICSASNSYGDSEKFFNIRVDESGSDEEDVENSKTISTFPSWALITTTAIFIVFSTIVVLLVWHQFRSKKSGLSKKQISGFYAGKFNQMLKSKQNDILQQIYCQPYKKELEICENDLKIEMDVIFGSGEFGIVYKGIYKQSTVVAVKTLRDDIEERDSKLLAFLEEVKLMTFLSEQQHPNIVSMIGCVTKHLHEGKLLVVLEYCPEGDLETYLKKQRTKLICKFPSADSGLDSEQSNYIPMSDIEQVYIVEFVSYSYQIACAMDYLAKEKFIHGDLAARNILLVDKNVVKVTDFGLSRRISKYKEYVKNNQGLVPWRWWSIESLQDFTFTSKSDVWSFGVLMWEIFSLAEVPYPGVTRSLDFLPMLKSGLRMLKPDLASDSLFSIMQKCWATSPDDRPTFQEICTELKQELNHMENYAKVSTEIQYIELRGEADDQTSL